MKKAAVVLMALAILSKLFGFGREIVLSYFYGASIVSDAYLISLTIPGTVFAFIGAGIATNYIPMYTEIEKNNGKSESNRFTSNIITLILFISTIIIILVFIKAEFFVKLFAYGFKGETFELAVKFTRISIVGIIFSGVMYILTGYLQIKNNFTIVAIMGIPFNLIIILFIALSAVFNQNILPFGIVLAMALEVLILIPFVYKMGYHYKLTISIKDKYVNRMLYLSLPVILGTSVNQINTLIDRTIASQLITGGISVLNYANRLNFFIQGVFVMSIATVMYPMISKMVASNNIVGLKKTLSEAINGVNLLLIPSMFGTMLFAEQIVSLFFGRGAFDVNAIHLTSNVLFFYSIGMLGFGLREILSRVFYSFQDTRTPMINAALGMGLNIILNIILSKFLGVNGLALATSISAIITALLMAITLYKKIGAINSKYLTITFVKILIASLIMSLAAKLSFNYFTEIFNQISALLTAILTGLLLYCILIYFMKIKEVDIIINSLRKKFSKVT